jgi:hypothetical protein
VHSVIFTQAARAELIEAQDWYDREATGLGRRFRQAIDTLVERMIAPGSFPPSLEMFDVPSCAAFRTRCSLSSKMTP